MSYNGAGVFQLAAGNPVVTGTTISSTWANNTLSDIANNGLSNCITKDGQQTVTANIPFNNNRLTGVANGVAASDAATIGQIQSGSAITLTGLSGTGDAIVANSAPAITAYSTGQAFLYIPTATNTITNPTINISTVGAKTITQSNGVGLWAGALVVGTPYVIVYDGTNFRIQSGQLGAPIPVSGSQLGFRNRFIDGGFNFWDSGITFSTSNAGQLYTADMWGIIAGAGAGVNATINQGAFTPGQEPIGMTSPALNFLQFVQAGGGGTGGSIFQRIESSFTLQGRSATISMWLWVSSGTLNIPAVFANQNFGSGGSGQVTNTFTANWTVTTTPQRFSLRIDLPSISGKTIGTNDYVAVGIQLPNSTAFTLNTTQWQLEDCPAGAPAAGLPTPFEWKGFEIERTRVSRFLQVLVSGSGTQPFALAYAQGSTNAIAMVNFQPMRGIPALTFATGSAANLFFISFPSTTITALTLTSTAVFTDPVIGARIDITFSGTAPTINTTSLVRNNNANTRLILDARL